MSLRTQALLAVAALALLSTGALLAVVTRLYESAERRRIDSDLATFAARQRKDCAVERVAIRGKLEAELAAQELASLVAAGRDVKEGFSTFTDDLLRRTTGDVAILALDALVAEDRGATVVAPRGDLAVVAVSSRKEYDATRARRALEDESVAALLARTAESNAGSSRILQAAGTIYMAVAAPVHDNLQERKFAAGAAAVLIEIGDLAFAADAERYSTDVDRRNPVRRIAFTGDVVAGRTVADAADAAALVAAARERPGIHEFEIALPDGRFIARVQPLAEEEGDSPAADVPRFVAVKSLDEELGPLRDLQVRVVLAGSAVAVLLAAAASALALSAIRRLRAVEAATHDVRAGRFDGRVPVRGRDEIASLASAFNDMLAGLRALGLYTDPSLAKTVVRGTAPGAAGSLVSGTVFFCDVAGFTTVAESLPPAALIGQLNEFFAAVSRAVKDEGGYVDKFIGDSVMAFFGPPFLDAPDHAARACRAAWRAGVLAGELRRKWSEAEKPVLRQRIGLATGEVVVGDVGGEGKMNFTVIGDAVNLASRLEGEAKAFRCETILAERTAREAGGAVLARELDLIRVRGRLSSERVFELLGARGESAPGAERRRAEYARALERYRADDLRAAAALLDALLAAAPDDGPAAALRERCVTAVTASSR